MFCLLQTSYQEVAKVATLIEKVNVVDLCFFRTWANFLIAIPLVLRGGKHPIRDLEAKDRGTLFFRSFVGTFGFIVIVYACKYLPIYLVQIFVNTSPFCSLILGYLVNGDRITLKQFGCMVGCFCGIVVLSLSQRDEQKGSTLQVT